MTATDLHSHVAAFWYALGRLDGEDDRRHAENVSDAEEFAGLAAVVQQIRPLPELFTNWFAPRSPVSGPNAHGTEAGDAGH